MPFSLWKEDVSELMLFIFVFHFFPSFLCVLIKPFLFYHVFQMNAVILYIVIFDSD